MKVFFAKLWQRWRFRLALGAVLGVLYVSLLYFGEDEAPAVWTYLGAMLKGGFVGVFLSALLAAAESFLLHDRFFRLPVRQVLLYRTLTYALVLQCWLSFLVPFSRAGEDSFALFFEQYITSGEFFRDSAFTLVSSLLFVAGSQLIKLIGFSPLLAYFTDKYHEPQQQTRCLLLIGLRDAGTLRQKLGAAAYGKFLQDFFFDLNEPIARCGGEIAQYRAAEMLVTWPSADGAVREKVLHCLAQMHEKLQQERNHYHHYFGHEPQLFAGLHAGSLWVTWVGEVQKSLLLMGAPLDVTTRLKAVCGRTQGLAVVSSAFLEEQKMPERLQRMPMPAIGASAEDAVKLEKLVYAQA